VTGEDRVEVSQHVVLDIGREANVPEAEVAVDPPIGVLAELDSVIRLVQARPDVEPGALKDAREDSGPGAAGRADDARTEREQPGRSDER
jgi:hypothetical protein